VISQQGAVSSELGAENSDLESVEKEIRFEVKG